MGIHGLLAHLGPGTRISFAKFSAQHYTKYSRPFRLAIDISIWLFQIQSGKGGSNPALRTFYYRLLRLLSLNVHPLFVFDGPNKPLFKRNKKVGGSGVKVATVPEFLAKQLLKEFGFPWHVAPGEAEAECALLQREGVVDAVLSEDVDTLMFGSAVTLRNWSGDGTTKGNKAPTHVSVYRAHETKERSGGIDREGMILVALMSGGDYIPEGVPGIGIKVACDAARAGFGKELCALDRKDKAGLKDWKDRLENEIQTNASKFFSRKNTGFTMPEDFPSREVLGYYTRPCVSTLEKVERLRREVKWDAEIDFAALRSFTADAFDWRCKGGAKKFIKNLAPALLVRELRSRERHEVAHNDPEAEETAEREFVHAIHGKRNHASADGELEYRISFTPANLVPIDLSLEEEDDEFTPAGGVDEDTDAESEVPSSTQGGADEEEDNAPASQNKRQFRPYYPDQPEKLWILRPFLHEGCPLIVEDYEASTQDPREFLKQRRIARAANKKDANIHPAKPVRKKKAVEREAMPENALMAYARITKAAAENARSSSNNDTDGTKRTMKELSPRTNARSKAPPLKADIDKEPSATAAAAFKLLSTRIPASMLRDQAMITNENSEVEALDLSKSSPAARTSRFPAGIDPLRPFAAFAAAHPSSSATRKPSGPQRTPRKTSRKRPPSEFSSPAMSQKPITSYYSPSPRKNIRDMPLLRSQSDIVDLVSSSPTPLPDLDDQVERPLTPTPQAKTRLSQLSASPTPRPQPAGLEAIGRLPGTVTKRRRKGSLKRSQTEPVGLRMEEDDVSTVYKHQAEQTIIISSSPAKSDGDLPSPSTFTLRLSQRQSQHDDALQGVPALGELSRSSDHADEPDFAGEGGFIRDEPVSLSLNNINKLPAHPSLPILDEDPPNQAPAFKLPTSTATHTKPTSRKAAKGIEARITLRKSLEGAWKEVQVEGSGKTEPAMLDMTGNGSGWKKSGGRAEIWSGWRKSGVEVLDLTGA